MPRGRPAGTKMMEIEGKKILCWPNGTPVAKEPRHRYVCTGGCPDCDPLLSVTGESPAFCPYDCSVIEWRRADAAPT